MDVVQSTPPGNIVTENGDTITLIEHIGEGGEAEVWKGFLKKHVIVQPPIEVAVKISKISGDLSNERHVYNQLSRSNLEIGPVYYGYGTLFDLEDKVSGDFLAFAFHGKSLADINKSLDPLDENEALLIGIDMLRNLKNLHSLGFIHRDVAPGNFLLKQNSIRHTPNVSIVITDFGVAESFMRHKMATGEPYHRSETPSKFSGTPLFASKRMLEGWSSSRRDDLESLGFVLLYLSGIKLSNFSPDRMFVKSDKILLAKERDDIDKISSGESRFSPVYVDRVRRYLKATRELSYSEDPDYAKLEGILSGRILE